MYPIKKLLLSSQSRQSRSRLSDRWQRLRLASKARSSRPQSRPGSSRHSPCSPKRAGLVGTLQQAGPYTVFAPTDAAFERVPKATLKALLNDRAKLRAVLLYHVVGGKVTAAKVDKLSSARTGER